MVLLCHSGCPSASAWRREPDILVSKAALRSSWCWKMALGHLVFAHTDPCGSCSSLTQVTLKLAQVCRIFIQAAKVFLDHGGDKMAGTRTASLGGSAISKGLSTVLSATLLATDQSSSPRP